jgi:4-amino-4-deoxy-L-arabinose transferase-like glycosyltransferase
MTLLLGPRRHLLLVGLMVAVFLALSIWWILYDQRLPSGDVPRHVATSDTFATAFEAGDVTGPLTEGDEFGYPPLVRLVGAVPFLVGLSGLDWPPIAIQLVFVPLLAFGCYGVGRLAFNPTAGVLAALFALGTPMVMQLFRVELLDAPLAAMVAVTLWALLASEGFSRTRESVLTGVLLGLALLVKAPAPAFLAGAVLVVLVRGGWRQPRNLALAAGATLLIAGPYYAINLSDYASLTEQAVVASRDPFTQSFGWTFDGARRFTVENFAWYVWTAINVQYLVPLLVLFSIGLVSTLRRLRRPFALELVAGLAVGYLVSTLLSVHDPRYTLPLVVYVAVLGTGWIAIAERRWVRTGGTAVLIAVTCVNVAAGTLGVLPTLKVAPIPGNEETDLIHPGAFTFVDKRGFYVGEPNSDPTLRELIDRIDDQGIETAELRFYEVPLMGTSAYGFQVAAALHDITTVERRPAALQHEPRVKPGAAPVVIITWWSSDPPLLGSAGLRELPPPCTTFEDGVVPPEVEAKRLNLLVERLRDGHYERWCSF